MMDIWPTIHIVILFSSVIGPSDEENVITALEHPDRVSRINLFVSAEVQLGKIAALMQEPFPVLTHLLINSENVSALPDEFLGRSAPPLRQLDLCNVLYPALPTLLLSAGNLVNLSLRNIPPTGYISPEVLIAHVAALLRLEILDVGLTSFPDPIISPLMTRTVLPALRNFTFSGRRKYFEDFISRIDAPRLNSMVVYYESGNNFDVLQLSGFIDRSERLKQSLSRHCNISLCEHDIDFITITFCVGRSTSPRWDPTPGISVRLSGRREGQFLHLTNILGVMAPMLFHAVHCTIHSILFLLCPSHCLEPLPQGKLTWLQLLRQLSSVQTLFVSYAITRIISDALTYLNGEMITQVLPALKLLYFGDQPTPSLDRFLAARRDSGHPVTIVQTKEEFEDKLKSYP